MREDIQALSWAPGSRHEVELNIVLPCIIQHFLQIHTVPPRTEHSFTVTCTEVLFPSCLTPLRPEQSLFDRDGEFSPMVGETNLNLSPYCPPIPVVYQKWNPSQIFQKRKTRVM